MVTAEDLVAASRGGAKLTIGKWVVDQERLMTQFAGTAAWSSKGELTLEAAEIIAEDMNKHKPWDKENMWHNRKTTERDPAQ